MIKPDSCLHTSLIDCLVPPADCFTPTKGVISLLFQSLIQLLAYHDGSRDNVISESIPVSIPHGKLNIERVSLHRLVTGKPMSSTCCCRRRHLPLKYQSGEILRKKRRFSKPVFPSHRPEQLSVKRPIVFRL